MFPAERRHTILQLVRKNGTVSLRELARAVADGDVDQRDRDQQDADQQDADQQDADRQDGDQRDDTGVTRRGALRWLIT